MAVHYYAILKAEPSASERVSLGDDFPDNNEDAIKAFLDSEFCEDSNDVGRFLGIRTSGLDCDEIIERLDGGILAENGDWLLVRADDVDEWP